MHASRLSVLAAAVAAALLSIGAPAAAGSLQVDPIRLEIGADRRTATLRLRNDEAVPVTIRAYPLAWSQQAGEDVYEESDALIVSPPIFTIAAGGTQLVRIGLRRPAADGRAYRVMVEEVPEASPGGVQVALRLNLPLFASLPAGEAADLAWSARREGDGWVLEAANRGSGWVRIEPEAAKAATGVDPQARIAFGTLLPGARRKWALGAEPMLADEARFQSITGARDDESGPDPRILD